MNATCYVCVTMYYRSSLFFWELPKYLTVCLGSTTAAQIFELHFFFLYYFEYTFKGKVIFVFVLAVLLRA